MPTATALPMRGKPRKASISKLTIQTVPLVSPAVTRHRTFSAEGRRMAILLSRSLILREHVWSQSRSPATLRSPDMEELIQDRRVRVKRFQNGFTLLEVLVAIV